MDCPVERCIFMYFNKDWDFQGLNYYEGEYFVSLEWHQDQCGTTDLSDNPSNILGAAFILKDFNFDLTEIKEKVKMTYILMNKITECINCQCPLKIEPMHDHEGKLVEYLCLCPNFRKKKFSKQGHGKSNNFTPDWALESFSACLGEYGIFIQQHKTIIHKYPETFGMKELITIPSFIQPNLKSREALLKQIKILMVFA